MNKLSFFFVLILVSYSFCQYYDIYGNTPNSAGITGKQNVIINGDGFKQFSTVSCIWGGRWVSTISIINSNTQIYCQTPVISSLEVSNGLPLVVDLQVVFDGTVIYDYSYSLVSYDFTFGPTLVSISPTNGFVQGGNLFSITGTGFQEFNSVVVKFDENQCTSATIVSDTLITCNVPSGVFNQEAMINIYFDNNPQFYLHSLQTYHYGPIFNQVIPPCGSVNGGQIITLLGLNLNDPIISSSIIPLGPPLVYAILEGTEYQATGVQYTGNSIVFTTPVIPNAAGKDVYFTVFFKQVASKVQISTPFRYGPIIYNQLNYGGFPPGPNPNPSSGHFGGGDSITISGCGFSLFNVSQVSPFIDVDSGSQQLCIRGAEPGSPDDTLRIIKGENLGADLIVCFTNQVPCTADNSLTREVYVDFTVNGAGILSLPPYNEAPLYYSPGPYISSISQNRATYTGLVSVNITGSNLFQNGFSTFTNPGWRARVTFSSIYENYQVIASITNNTLITFETPSTYWGISTQVTVDFISLSSDNEICSDFPRNAPPFDFYFGPQCSSLTPTNGWLSGNRTVQINGIGFTESNAIQNILMCNNRLNGFNCSIGDSLTPTLTTNTQVQFKTPSIRDGITTAVGGNRLFGDVSSVYIFFNVPQEDLPNNLTVAQLYCGDYTYGPNVDSITPTYGPMGPRGDNLPGTSITVKGSAFNDPLYNKNIDVVIGSVSTFNTGVSSGDIALSDTVIYGKTSWGGRSGNTENINVVFNTCNTTFSDFYLTWGPGISPTGLTIDNRSPISTNNPNLDIWGVLPWGGQTITVSGNGFSEYYYYYDFGEFIFEYFDASCIIDGVYVNTTYIDDNTLVCVTPPRDFGTNATLAVEFGYFECTYDQSKQILIAQQRLLYTPRFDSFTPNFGLTSGGQPVTVYGEGFIGWTNYYCFFGQYTDGKSINPSSDGTSIACTTPYHRGGFNTDVFVGIELYDPLETFEFDMKVVSKTTYHYGPICNAISPYAGQVIGGYIVTLSGQGFQDCVISDNQPFRNCIFETFNVSLRDPISGERVFAIPVDNNTLNNPNTATALQFYAPNGTCMYEPIIEINFIDAIVLYSEQHFVTCQNSYTNRLFQYGPYVSSISSQYTRNGMSYGWEGDQVTINGINFAESNAFDSINCYFGNESADSVLVSDTQIVCTAPAGEWNTIVNITLVFNSTDGEYSCSGNTTIFAGLFHYGPVIDSVTPTRGYVQATTTLTISGFAFGCCGIDEWYCLLPTGKYNSTVRSGDTVTCPTPFAPNVGYLLANIGVLFASTDFNGTNYLTLTEANTVLTYYYGPIISGISPSITTLSSTAIPITISGIGFADPFLGTTLCDFYSTTGGINSIGITPISVTDTTIVCISSSYTHVCGDIDNLSPRWITILGQTYTYNNVPFVPPIKPSLPYFTPATIGTRIYYGPIYYGASITSVTVNVGDGPDGSPDGSISSWTSGGLQLVITADSLSDWISPDVGNGNAYCVFGNRYSYTLSTIGYNSDSNSVYCTVPQGNFGLTGKVTLILNPNVYSATIINNVWTWVPYAVNFNRPWGTLGGFETVVINGGGFCSSYSFQCLFGDSIGHQADIIDDTHVVCQTPYLSSGSNSVVKLQILNYGRDTEAYTVTVIENFRHVGVSKIFPTSGPTCGNTLVSITGYGFEFFDQFQCQFAGKITPATKISNTSLTCNTPNVDVKVTKDIIRCSSFNLLLLQKDGAQLTVRTGISFEFGVPEAISVTPNNSVITETTQVTVVGEYFNGGQEIGSYLCQWGSYPPQPAQKITLLPNNQYELICHTPSLSTIPSLTVGEVDFEVSVDCPSTSRFTTSNLKFLFTQLPFISSIDPSLGPEFGGTNVTVKGYFAGGSSYLCSFGKVFVSAHVINDQSLWCISPAYKNLTTGLDVPFYVSIDGGRNLITYRSSYTYQNVKCGAGSLSPAILISISIILFTFLFF